MKNKLYILCFIALFGSCDNFVDILPKGKNIPTTVDDLAKILNHDWNVNGGGMNWFYMTDDAYLSEEKLKSVGSTTQNMYTWAPYIYTSMEHDADWESAYGVLYYANYVIENILTAPESTSRTFNREETYGRALLLRAYTYWYLVTAYAPYCTEAEAEKILAVPMPLASNINNQYSRSTVAEAMECIFEDINTALSLKGLSAWREFNNWPCKAAGYALLSRIYLWQGQWEKAAQNAGEVLKIHDFLSDYNSMVMNDPDNAAKGVMGYQNRAIFDPEVILNQTAGNNFTDVVISDGLKNCYDQAKDLRFRYCFSMKDKQGNLLDALTRFNDEETFDGIRMSEVYLNRMEALVRMGGTENMKTAHALLAKLRTCRYENPDNLDTSMGQDALLEEILLERRREFRFTYMRWFDMKRLKVTVTRAGLNGEQVTLDGNSHRYTWAIPLDVMNYNSQLIQNER